MIHKDQELEDQELVCLLYGLAFSIPASGAVSKARASMQQTAYYIDIPSTPWEKTHYDVRIFKI
jgi:hypothetical protein